MVAHTGGYAPQTGATPLMRTLAAERSFGIRTRSYVWLGVSLVIVLILQRTALAALSMRSATRRRRRTLAGVIRSRDGRLLRLCGLTAGIAGVLLAAIRRRPTRAWAMPTCCLHLGVVIANQHPRGGVATSERSSA